MALRLGLVGRGRWGRNIERTLSSFDGVSITVMAKGQIERGLDGILIATPSVTHAELALPYIEQGVPTFIEKPIATSVADADRIKAAAERSGALVVGGHIQLHNPAFQMLLELVPALGPIRLVHCESRNDKPRTDCSVLWDWMPHHLSMAQSVFGQAAESAAAWRLSGSGQIDSAAAHFKFGATSMVSMVDWLSPLPLNMIAIAAEQGVIVFDDRAPRKLAITRRDGTVSHPAYDAELPLTRELRTFVQAIRSGDNKRDDLEFGLSVVRAIAAAETSIAGNGAPVPV